MSTQVDLLESPANRPTRGTLGRVGLTVMGVVTVVTTLISAVTVWLMLTRPLEVAGALRRGTGHGGGQGAGRPDGLGAPRSGQVSVGAARRVRRT